MRVLLVAVSYASDTNKKEEIEQHDLPFVLSFENQQIRIYRCVYYIAKIAFFQYIRLPYSKKAFVP